MRRIHPAETALSLLREASHRTSTSIPTSSSSSSTTTAAPFICNLCRTQAVRTYYKARNIPPPRPAKSKLYTGRGPHLTVKERLRLRFPESFPPQEETKDEARLRRRETQQANLEAAAVTASEIGGSGLETFTSDDGARVYEVAGIVDHSTHRDYNASIRFSDDTMWIGGEAYIKKRADRGEVYDGFYPKWSPKMRHPLSPDQWKNLLHSVAVEVLALKAAGRDLDDVCTARGDVARWSRLQHVTIVPGQDGAEATLAFENPDQRGELLAAIPVQRPDELDDAGKPVVVKRGNALRGRALREEAEALASHAGNEVDNSNAGPALEADARREGEAAAAAKSTRSTGPSASEEQQIAKTDLQDVASPEVAGPAAPSQEQSASPGASTWMDRVPLPHREGMLKSFYLTQKNDFRIAISAGGAHGAPRDASTWSQISISDPRVKLAIVKRIAQLTARRLPDPLTSTITTLADLNRAIIASAPQDNRVASALSRSTPQDQTPPPPNLAVSPRPQRPRDADFALGRSKLIADELARRGLLGKEADFRGVRLGLKPFGKIAPGYNLAVLRYRQLNAWRKGWPGFRGARPTRRSHARAN